MQWIIDELQIQLDFFRYRIIHGPQTEKSINDSKQKITDLELALSKLTKGKG